MRDAGAIERCSSDAGSGALRFFARNGKTAIATARARSPLRLIATRGGATAWVFTTTFGGGFVDGDAIELRVDVEPGARALLTTQASTKIFRSPSGTESSLVARVHEGGLLAIVNDPIVPYEGARHRQQTSIDLQGSGQGSVAFVDVLSAGRVARGERWAFSRFESELRLEGVLHDVLRLDAEDGPIERRMGRFDTLATILLAGPLTEAARARIARELGAAPVGKGESFIESASARGEALLVRIAGKDTSTMHARVRDRLREIVDALGVDPFARKP